MTHQAVRAAALAFAAVLALAAGAAAQEPSTDDLVRALTPSASAKSIGVQQRIPDPVQSEAAAAIAVIRRQQPPSVNVRLAFEYDSDRLTGETRQSLDRLVAALNDNRLAAYHFIVAGHTDGRGSDAYNDVLSERRAAAVRNYLIVVGNVAPSRLTAIGFGERDLLDPGNPDDGINRRVQIINQL